MEKINIVFIGSCTARDILCTDLTYTNDFDFLGNYYGSISRSNYKPGLVAERLQEEFIKTRPPFIHHLINDQINMITKKKTPRNLVNNLPPNTVVLLDYAYELLNFYTNGSETFDLHANYNTLKVHLPQWLRDDILKNFKHFDSNTIEMAYRQFHEIYDFYKMLKSNNIPVIVFTDTYSSKIYDKTTNKVGEILNIFNKRMPFYQSNMLNDEMMQYKYSLKIIKNFYEQIYKRIDQSDFFEIPLTDVYADPDHKHGYHPVHYHYTCRIVLHKLLKSKIIETLTKSKTNLSVPQIII
jgi:hypothetical protein